MIVNQEVHVVKVRNPAPLINFYKVSAQVRIKVVCHVWSVVILTKLPNTNAQDVALNTVASAAIKSINWRALRSNQRITIPSNPD